MTKETVGKLSSDLIVKQVDDQHNAHDQMLEQLSDWDKELFACVETFKKSFLGDFYVVVITKKERLMQNVLRNYFTGRLSCPTPEYDQTLYKYNKHDDSVDFMWVVPSKDTCYHMYNHALEIPKSEHELLTYVLRFMSGDLLKEAKRLNNEQIDSPLLVER